jgi:hypothetical protein
MMYARALLALTLALMWHNAQASPPQGPDRPGVVRVRQPHGPPTRASSFEPHHLGTHVFGAPIQAPILFSAHRSNSGQGH